MPQMKGLKELKLLVSNETKAADMAGASRRFKVLVRKPYLPLSHCQDRNRG